MDNLEKQIDKELSKKVDKIFETNAEKFFNIFKELTIKEEGLDDIKDSELGNHFNLAFSLYQFGLKYLKEEDKEYGTKLLKRFNKTYRLYKLRDKKGTL